ncbi:MAG: LytR/AlgR family response regulator transcription factor [Parabacteroides sp.]
MGVSDRNIPTYIYEKNNMVRLILWTAFFALVFINIYKPFSSSSWYAVSEFKFFVFSSLIILTGVLVVVISRIIMYYWGKRHCISLLRYSCWILLEIVFMSLFYTVYTLVLNPENDYWQTFKESAVNTSLVLLLPYSVLHLVFAYQDKERRLQQLEEDRAETASRPPVITFYDEKNDPRFSVKRANLLYLESADNYVCIWYLNKGQLSKFLLRNSLKNLEESMSDTNVFRCHRSYMVNFDHVKVIRREKESVYLELGEEGVPDIPISKTYADRVTRWFMSCPDMAR